MRTSSRTPARATAAVLVTGLAASLALTATPATASDPGESTITGSVKPGASESRWTGTIANPGLEAAEALGAVDEHALTVKAPGKGTKAKKYFQKYAATLEVVVSWTGAYNDLDLRVFDENGTEVAVDGAFATESETVTVPISAPGTYTVTVTSFLAEPGIAYDAVATLTTSK